MKSNLELQYIHVLLLNFILSKLILNTFSQEDLESALNLKRLVEGDNSINVSVTQSGSLEASYTKEQLKAALESKGVELG